MTQLIIICIYLSLLLGLGIFSSRLFKGTSKDYMLASHSIGPFLLLMSIFGTTMTAFALVGSTGEAYKQGVGVYGMLASSSGIIHSLCFFVIGVKMWDWGRKFGYTTQAQFFRDRLESDKIGLLLFPILVGLVIPYLLIGVIASGTVINGLTEGALPFDALATSDFGVPKWLGSLAICIVVLVYVFFGGMRGTAWANTFQTIVFMILGIVTFFLIASKLGGPAEASKAVLAKHPSKMMRGITEDETESFEKKVAGWRSMAELNYVTKIKKSATFTPEQMAAAQAKYNPKDIILLKGPANGRFAKEVGLLDLTKEEQARAWFAQDDRNVPEGAKVLDEDGEPLPLSTYQRIDEDVLKAKVYAIPPIKAKLWTTEDIVEEGNPAEGKWTYKQAFGIYRATSWAPDEPEPISYWRFFTYMLVPLSVGMFPHLFQHWLTAKSASSFKLPVVAHPVFIMIVWVPCVLVGVWATTAMSPSGGPIIPPHFPANAVLAKMVKDLTGPLLGGFLTAGILAAIMSSLDSQFLCLGTMFTNDVVVHYGGKNRFTDKQQLWMARGFIVAIVAITYLLGLLPQRRVFQMGVWCFSGFSSLFPVVLAAVYWKRLTKAGVYAGVLAAFSSWAYMFWASDFANNAKYSLFGLDLMPVTWMVVASASALVIVSLVTPPPSKETLDRFYPPDAAND